MPFGGYVSLGVLQMRGWRHSGESKPQQRGLTPVLRRSVEITSVKQTFELNSQQLMLDWPLFPKAVVQSSRNTSN